MPCLKSQWWRANLFGSISETTYSNWRVPEISPYSPLPAKVNVGNVSNSDKLPNSISFTCQSDRSLVLQSVPQKPRTNTRWRVPAGALPGAQLSELVLKLLDTIKWHSRSHLVIVFSLLKQFTLWCYWQICSAKSVQEVTKTVITTGDLLISSRNCLMTT